MKIIIELASDCEIKMPLSYNYYVQSLVYNLISDKNYAEFLHNKGYNYGNRTFKLFTFSKLEGDFVLDRNTKTLNFTKKRMSLSITSPSEEFIKYVGETLLLKGEVHLHKNKLFVESVKFEDNHINTNNVKFYTKTPIVISSTLASGQTVFYSPLDYCFNERIKSNILKKYNAFYGTTLDDIDLTINVIGNKIKKKVVRYKKMIINGYMCELEFIGDAKILDFIYSASIGEKNSQGFGMLELKKTIREWIYDWKL